MSNKENSQSDKKMRRNAVDKRVLINYNKP